VNPPLSASAADASMAAALAALAERDPRYRRQAYEVVLAALAQAQHEAVDAASRSRRPAASHVGGEAILEALRRLALAEYGPLAYRVLTTWGLRRTEDVGAVVFALIEAGLLSATAEDSPADFADGYDFVTAFVEPFAESGDMPAGLPPLG